MKYLIVQKEVLDEMFVCESEIEEFVNFLKNDFFGYILVCDYENLAEYIQASLQNPLLEILMDKYHNIFFNKNLTAEFSNDAFYRTLGEKNIFLINESVAKCQELKDERGYMFLSISNINQKWGELKESIKGVHFKVTQSSMIPNEQKFDNWEKLQKFLENTTSFIMFDKYILNDVTDQKMKDNLFPILDILCKQNNYKKTIHISIITELKSGVQIEGKHKQIEEYLQSKGYSNFKLSLIKYDHQFCHKNQDRLHSRFIITNYYHIKCDGSFNFFKSNGKINQDADIRINFALNKKHNYFYEKELNDLKMYMGNIKNDNHFNIDYKTMFYKDKDHYLIN